MLGQCTALAHLNLEYNYIGDVGEGRLRASLRGQTSGLVLKEEEEDDDEDEEGEEDRENADAQAALTDSMG